jgi:hypothetical protein
MKILILAQTRSGSSTLTKAIASASGLPLLWEPFRPMNPGNHKLQAKRIIEDKDLLTKIVDNNFTFYPEFYDHKSFISNFDLVVGLTREDDEDNAFSKRVAELTNDWQSSSKTHQIEASEVFDERYLNVLEESKKYKREIRSFDIFQITYEGIFINKTDIKRLENYLGFSIPGIN